MLKVTDFRYLGGWPQWDSPARLYAELDRTDPWLQMLLCGRPHGETMAGWKERTHTEWDFQGEKREQAPAIQKCCKTIPYSDHNHATHIHNSQSVLHSHCTEKDDWDTYISQLVDLLEARLQEGLEGNTVQENDNTKWKTHTQQTCIKLLENVLVKIDRNKLYFLDNCARIIQLNKQGF